MRLRLNPPRKPEALEEKLGEETMKYLTTAFAAGVALAALGGTACAQISDDVVKIGVLTDM